MSKILMIDPPEGWRYGFPRAIPQDIVDHDKWLIENGYPESQIKRYGDHFHCRYWYQETENQNPITE